MEIPWRKRGGCVEMQSRCRQSIRILSDCRFPQQVSVLIQEYGSGRSELLVY
jgi:hypothetical protein